MTDLKWYCHSISNDFNAKQNCTDMTFCIYLSLSRFKITREPIFFYEKSLPNTMHCCSSLSNVILKWDFYGVKFHSSWICLLFSNWWEPRRRERRQFEIHKTISKTMMMAQNWIVSWKRKSHRPFDLNRIVLIKFQIDDKFIFISIDWHRWS